MPTDKPRKHSILFKPFMVDAIIDGRKRVTRRMPKIQPAHADAVNWRTHIVRTPMTNEPDWFHYHQANAANWQNIKKFKAKYSVGDTLWVKEQHWAWGKWHFTGKTTKTGMQKRLFQRDMSRPVLFEEPDQVLPDRSRKMETGWHKRSSLFMFERDSRLSLTVTDFKIERLQDISVTEAPLEGIDPVELEGGHIGYKNYRNDHGPFECPVDSFHSLWDSINWETHPWVSNPMVEAYEFDVDLQKGIEHG